MKRSAYALVTVSTLAAYLGVAWLVSPPSPRMQAQEKTSPILDKKLTAYLSKHCFSCHGPEKKKAGIALHIYKDEADVLKDRKRWQSVLHMLTAGEMPPPERTRPKLEDTEAFIAGINGIFARHDKNARRDPGRVTMRRLNRTEYNNTIRDLVGVDFQPADDFPTDDVGYGFDNIGDVLTVSPVLMERYLAAAEAIMGRAIITGTPPPIGNRPVIARFLEPAQGKDIRVRELTKDRLHAQIKVSADGDYTFRVRMSGRSADKELPKIALLADDKQLSVVDVKLGEKKGEFYEAKLPLKEGTTRFSAKLLNPGGEPARAVVIERFELVGPADPYPATHRKLLASKADTKEAKTREILTRFATRAYRRPPAKDEMDRLIAFAADAETQGESWVGSISLAMRAVLCSPKFLFRVELDDRPDHPQPHAIDDYQLASRLSYFLWSTMPDDELFAQAAAKQLHANLEPQVRRMLKDPKAAALVQNFAVQWLHLGTLKSNHMPSAELFPEFTDKLRAAMLKETELYFQEIVQGNRSILELIDSDYTFVNERLARHYGIPYPGKSGGGFGGRFGGGNDKFEKVTFKNGERGGLLTQASILTVNSNPTRTNPVKRGKWVLEQLLGTAPPPPPPDVPELPESKEKLQGTLRQRLEQHRRDPACANCHAKMDPLGLAFENYDAIGRFRTKEGELPIDPSGSLPNGQKFKGPQELKKILLEKKDLFSRCLTEKMLTYALGRGLDYYDKPAVDQTLAALAKNDYRFITMVVEIAKSEPFRLRRGKDQDR